MDLVITQLSVKSEDLGLNIRVNGFSGKDLFLEKDVLELSLWSISKGDVSGKI